MKGEGSLLGGLLPFPLRRVLLDQNFKLDAVLGRTQNHLGLSQTLKNCYL